MNIQQLLMQLPRVGRWIEQTLKDHKSQARSVASYGFSRLPQFYSADTLANAFVIEVPQVPVPPLSQLGLTGFQEFENGNYAGITFLNSYFVQKDRHRDESLHFHELVHTIQWRHLGPDRFLAAYAAGYLAGGSYQNNPLEVMAYGLQHYFDSGKPPGNVEALICRQLDEQVTPMLQRVMKGDAKS